MYFCMYIFVHRHVCVSLYLDVYECTFLHAHICVCAYLCVLY